MPRFLAVLVLACASGVARADDEAIVKRLKAVGVPVGPFDSEGGLAVILDKNNLDTALPELCELRTLRSVCLNHLGLTDNQLRRVCALGVKHLHFCDCSITAARLKIVARARGLEGLGLTDTAIIDSTITDEGLAELKGLRDLKYLHLDGAALTDAGLHHFEGMKKLRQLDLGCCRNVTDAGVARLQKALPQCRINY
jgi:F-box/leucine-rich repeat protein 14